VVAAPGSWQEALLAGVAIAPRERPRAGYVLARLGGFASIRGVPAAPECLLDYDVIEAFCVHGLAGRASATRGHLPVGALPARCGGAWPAGAAGTLACVREMGRYSGLLPRVLVDRCPGATADDDGGR